MVKDEKIRRAAIAACKSYGQIYGFVCPICKGLASAKMSVMGAIQAECKGCQKSYAWPIKEREKT